jgi:hypothetical protein
MLITSGIALSPLDRGCSRELSNSSSDILVEATLSIPDSNIPFIGYKPLKQGLNITVCQKI